MTRHRTIDDRVSCRNPLSCFLALWLVVLGAPAYPQGMTGMHETEVRFTNDSITLAGTLAVPDGPGPHPAMVLITGSGPQNRDCVMHGFPMFKALSDMLVPMGIAVLRYDDRGVGGSTGVLTRSTLDDFARDAEAGAAFLRARTDIRPDRIGLLGHSEGGAVAQIAAARTPMACIVMLAGPGVGIRANILMQTELIGRADGTAEEQIQRDVALRRDIFDVLAGGGDVSSLMPQFVSKARADRAAMDEQMQRALHDLEWYARTLYNQHMEMMDTPWFRSAITFEPDSHLPATSCPMLAVFGERDLQVPAEINAEALRRHAANCPDADISIQILPGANHLFQVARTGSPAEYGRLRREFSPDFSGILNGWLKRTLW